MGCFHGASVVVTAVVVGRYGVAFYHELARAPRAVNCAMHRAIESAEAGSNLLHLTPRPDRS